MPSDHPIVRQIDHVYVPLEDAKSAFDFVTKTLNLPEAWPYADYGSFGSGGVTLGNLNFELLKGSDWPTAIPQKPARVTGIAFEPSGEIDELIQALDSRGIGHTAPMPYVSQDANTPSWTNLGFYVTEGTFACKYHFDVTARRKQLRKEFDDRDGGSLHLAEVAALVIETTDLELSLERWAPLLAPLPVAADNSWVVGDGPAVRLIAGPTNHVSHLQIRVRDLEAARSGAEQAGVDITEKSGSLWIAPDELEGLAFELIA